MKTFFKWLLGAYLTCAILPALFFFCAELAGTDGVAAAFAAFFAALVLIGAWLLQFFIPIAIVGALVIGINE